MKDDPIWLRVDTILRVHDEQLDVHGGATGIRDEALLESALGRARHQFAYGESDLCTLAASYAYGIANNHPFIDGNKRAAFLAAYTFLFINGVQLNASTADAFHTTLALADKTVSESEYAQWLRDNTRPVNP